MATLTTGAHQETSHFASMWNGSEDEDYKMFLDLQMDYGDADMDPLYKTFLEHVRDDGHSYILEMADGDHGLPAFVKYEDENESFEEIDAEPQRSPQNISHKNDRKRDSANKFSHVKGKPSQESVETHTSLDSESRFKTASSFVDESYQIFLRHVRLEDFSMILEWKSHIVRYEEVNGESNSFEGPTTENTLHYDEQGLVPYGSTHCGSHAADVDDSPTVTRRLNDPSQFRRQLNEILTRPFDQNEYEQLLKEANDRKPLMKHKHLRSMSISYATNEMGMSYLNHHPDLKKLVESADCHKGLELLRGFFFWLKNLCHEGAFMPWLSVPSSSDTLLTSGHEIVLPLCTGDGVQGALLSSPSPVEDVMGGEKYCNDLIDLTCLDT